MPELSEVRTAIPRSLPDDVVAYGRTPGFTPETLPEALQSGHTTKLGVWGLLHVLEGRLLYAFELPHTGQMVLSAGETAPIPPRVPHRVTFTEYGRFYVEFHKKPLSTNKVGDGSAIARRSPHMNAPGLA